MDNMLQVSDASANASCLSSRQTSAVKILDAPDVLNPHWRVPQGCTKDGSLTPTAVHGRPTNLERRSIHSPTQYARRLPFARSWIHNGHSHQRIRPLRLIKRATTVDDRLVL